MYDFLLQINSKSFHSPYKENNYFERKDTENIDANDSWFRLNGLSSKNKYYHSDSNNLLWIYGNIFLRNGYKDNYYRDIAAENVLTDLLNHQDIHHKYKGNYCIFRIDKKTRSIQILSLIHI